LSRSAFSSTTVEFILECHLKFSLEQPAGKAVGAFCAAGVKALLEYFQRRDLTKKASALVTKIILEADAAFDVHVEDDVFPFRPDPLDLGFQRAIEVAGIYLFPFDKLVVIDLPFELFGCEEIIIFSVGLGTAALIACGRGDRKSRSGFCCNRCFTMVVFPEPRVLKRSTPYPPSGDILGDLTFDLGHELGGSR